MEKTIFAILTTFVLEIMALNKNVALVLHVAIVDDGLGVIQNQALFATSSQPAPPASTARGCLHSGH
jgi:hypothetical protein